MANFPVLDLERPDTTSEPPHYNVRVESDRIMSASFEKLDKFAGHTSASFHETFYVSGALSNHLGTGTGSDGGEFYGGLAYAQADRIITNVVAFQRMSGSGGVTTVNVLTGSKNNTFVSIFSDLALKPRCSASDGDFFVSSAKTFVNEKWPAGYLLGVALDSVVDGPAADLTVQVYWKPSASYA